jgi:hypothetical protein
VADLAAKTIATANDMLFGLHVSRRTLWDTIQAQEALSSRRIEDRDEGELFPSRQLTMKVDDAAVLQRCEERCVELLSGHMGRYISDEQIHCCGEERLSVLPDGCKRHGRKV